MRDADISLRDELVQHEAMNEGYHPRMEKLHNANAAALEEIMDEVGYPGLSMVGKAGSNACWLIIQHAIGQPAFMKKSLVFLREATSAKESDPNLLAYLSDRIAVLEGRLQKYGTQFDWDEHGEMSPSPLDNVSLVNLRRQKLGLNSVEEQTDLMRKQAQDENLNPPEDLTQHQADYDAFRRRVGWT